MTSSQTDADYFLRSVRISSFNPPRKASNKSQARSGKATGSQKFAARAWPHPKSFKPNPDTLAAAGFFFTAPLDENAGPDQAECFMCARSLAGWEKDDDPHYEHARREADCPWAVAVCSIQQDRVSPGQLNWIFRSEDRLPASRALEKARLGTFDKRWPHDGVKGHLATSKKMAKAGFVFTPTETSADMATCLYCNMVLDGWEPKDSPMNEHKRRSPDCPVFIAQVEHEDDEPVMPAKTTSKSKTKKASSVVPQSADLPKAHSSSESTRSKRSTRATTNKKQPAIEEESEADPPNPPQSTSLSKSTRTRAGKSKPKHTAEESVVEEEEEVLELVVPVIKQASRTAPSRGAKAQARSVSASHKKQPPSESEQPSESQVSTSLAKSTRKKAGRAPPPPVPAEDEQSQTSRRTAASGFKKPTPKAGSEEEIEEIVSPPRPKKTLNKKTKPTKASPVADEEEVAISEDVVSDQNTPKPSSGTKGKIKSTKTASKNLIATKPKVVKADEVTMADDSLSAGPSADEMGHESATAESEQDAGATTDTKTAISQSAELEEGQPNKGMADPRSPKSTLLRHPNLQDSAQPLQPNPLPPSTDATPRAVNKQQPVAINQAPILATITSQGLEAFTAAERSMTLEQYIMHRMEIECEQIRIDGQREIDAFSEEARRVRRLIEDA